MIAQSPYLRMQKIFGSITILLFGICPFLIACQTPSPGKGAPKVVEGKLDLSQWNFLKDGTVKLNGNWDFYWKQLWTPQDFENPSSLQKTGTLEVPNSWNDHIVDQEPLSGEGYATFRMVVQTQPSETLYALKILAMATAYRLWVNGKEISSNGTVGKTPETMVPQYQPRVALIPEVADRLDVVMQISNFHHQKGGLWEGIELGTASQIYRIRERQIAFDLFLFGTLMIMAIYHFGLYSLRRKDFSTLYFGFFCFVISIRILVMGERYITEVISPWNWELLIKIEYLTFYLALPLFAMFLRSLYPLEFSKRVNQALQILGGVFTLIALVFPAKIYTQTVMIYQLIALVACLYTLYALVVAGIRKRDGAAGALIGFFILFGTFVNDVLNANELIATGYFVPFGLFMFIFAQSFILSLRFANAFISIENLSLTFQKFVPSKFLTHIAKGGIETIELGNAESSSITVLFSDIRSFTALSENITPQELLNFLNAYFQRMNKPIHENNGIIDKFIGDAIMALFDDASGDRSEEAFDAVKAAIAMQEELREYNRHRHRSGYPPIANGIGIHSGPVVIGTVGSKDRMDSTVLGDVVNLASRLEGLTKYYQVPIIISSDTHQLLKDKPPFFCRELDFVHVKGKENPVGIFEIFDCDIEPIRNKKQQNLEIYQKGLMSYYSRNWEEAAQMFEQCLKVYPEDPVSQIYVVRCHENQINPPEADWNGSMRLRRTP